jgi:hypothetical protein
MCKGRSFIDDHYSLRGKSHVSPLLLNFAPTTHLRTPVILSLSSRSIPQFLQISGDIAQLDGSASPSSAETVPW